MSRPQFAKRFVGIEIPPIPTCTEVRAARIVAGHTQAQAAAAMGYSTHVRLSEIERGVTPMDPVRWGWYLLATGQHPTHRLAARRMPAEVPA